MGRFACLLKNSVPRFKILRDLRRSSIPRDAFGLKVDERLPETGATNGKTDKTWHARRRLEPMRHTLLACSTPQHNKANILTTIAMRHIDDHLTIGTLIQPLDFPDIWFYSCPP